MSLILQSEHYPLLQSELGVFDAILKLDGQVYREMDGRKTFCVELSHGKYFVKYHAGMKIKELFKNLFRLKWPVLGAHTEWKAIKHLSQAGIKTLEPIGFAQKGFNPLTRQSFLITKALKQPTPLDQLLQKRSNFKIKRRLNFEVARTLRVMHQLGYVHKDCYLCHFLVTQSNSVTLIDLHRAVRPYFFIDRWKEKDLSQLFFSSRHCGLSRKDAFRFLKVYFNEDCLRTVFSKYQRILYRAVQKANALYLRYYRRFIQESENWSDVPLFNSQDTLFPKVLLVSGELEPIVVTQLIRQVPSKRRVFFGTWYKMPVVIKFYEDPLKSYVHFKKELSGINALKKANILTPELIYHGSCAGVKGYAIVLKRVTSVKNPETYKNVSDGLCFLQRLMPLLRTMHEAGLYQADMHPHNYLETEDSIYVIDGAEIIQTQKMSQANRLDNLALLFAQFSLDYLPHLKKLYDSYWLGEMPLSFEDFLQSFKSLYRKRLKRLRQKALRNTSQNLLKKRSGETLLCRREWGEVDFSKLPKHFDSPQQYLKQGNSATVIQTEFEKHLLVIKRYNLKNTFSFFKRNFKETRAEKAWASAEVLTLMNLQTPVPQFLYQRDWFGFKLETYLGFLPSRGVLLSEYLKEYSLRDIRCVFLAVRKICDWFDFVGLVHGDFKISNFMVYENNLELIDLDSCHFVRAEKPNYKDRQRFCENFEVHTPIGALCEAILWEGIER